MACLRKWMPALLGGAVTGLVLLLQTISYRAESVDFLQRLEWMTYDWRVRLATNHSSLNATNLGFVSIDDDTIREVASGRLGYTNGLYWPRFIYGHLVQELNTQGAAAVAFDVLFPDLRPDQDQMLPGGPGTSDGYFAAVMGLNGNVLLAADTNALPAPLFRQQAWNVGDVAARRERDGILRRTKAFTHYLVWHPMITGAERTIEGFRYSTNEILFPQKGRPPVRLPVDASGNFDQSLLYELVAQAHGRPAAFPTNVNRLSQVCTRLRVWDLGLALAAYHLKLDLEHPQFEPGRIILRGPGSLRRVIPVDDEHRFHIEWSLTPHDPDLLHETMHSLLHNHRARELGETNLVSRWAGRLVLVGSAATGNDLTDMGATPLEKQTLTTSRNWNIANSLLTGRFIRQSGPGLNALVIMALCLAGGWITWKFRALSAALCVVLFIVLYSVIAMQAYLQARLWLPIVLPCAGLLLVHFTLVTYRAIFEQKERRRIRNIFDHIVSPNVVNELLKAESLSLDGVRREVTVFFSDVRGFTELTDDSHARAEEYVREKKLPPDQAEIYFDEQAQLVLRTVNLYLGIIADTVKQHVGTLDKYIGDCVMAFWGAPTPNEKHAVGCVRAAIEAQRAIFALNEQRAAENRRREAENTRRTAAGLPALPLLRLLAMGTGINTGTVTIGLMGSERHISNYTVFGRDVNLASRLEGLSGRGRILIGEGTFRALQRDEPLLAKACAEMAPVMVKGFRTPIKVYEVIWREKPASTPDTAVIRASTPTVLGSKAEA